ncbi:uncharacterized protein LOC132611675 [Lycium barbarum]|uniref:uncharacterized protein LOC132611675 n=1 Tax=Lycium barbarum TaxID=112863 RepID=UPI00293E624D|nr:uncharacterized protein LOC132611675 [Lycium barbarum]
MGFAEHLINMIRRLIANNWYSVLLNGQATAQVLSRALNSLFEDIRYIGYGMPKWTNPMNHLAYADDTIIFTSAYSLKCIMNILSKYEQMSGQLINKGKSSFYMYSKIGNELIQEVGDCTGFAKGQFPFTYLGCPITHTRKKKVFYSDLIKKVKSRLLAWKGKLLSYGGKAVLIKTVLQIMPIHLLSVIAPPKCVLHELHKLFAKYFWSNKEERKSRHWAAWTSSTMWTNYRWNKYCKKHIPTLVQWKGGTQVWKKMLEMRDAIEHEI